MEGETNETKSRPPCNGHIGIVGIGQGGNNVAQELEARGLQVLQINSSMEDLATLRNPSNVYHIKTGEGSARNRDRIKSLAAADHEGILSAINAKIDGEIILVAFSAGGGTGSGLAPMLCQLLLMQGRQVGAIVILPGSHEMAKAQMNAYSCLNRKYAHGKPKSGGTWPLFGAVRERIFYSNSYIHMEAYF